MVMQEIHKFLEKGQIACCEHPITCKIIGVIVLIVAGLLLYKLGVAVGKFAWNLEH